MTSQRSRLPSRRWCRRESTCPGSSVPASAARASQAMVARDLVMSSLINRCVPFNFLAFRITAVLVLCVVKRTIISRGGRTVLGLPPNAMGAHQVAGADLDVELVGSEFLDEPVGLLVRRLRQTANPHRVATRVLL